MFILHINGHSHTRGTPGRIATLWGRYTEHTGAYLNIRRAFPSKSNFNRDPYMCGDCAFINPYGGVFGGRNRNEMKALIKKADVIHCHDDAYPTLEGAGFKTGALASGKKALCYHAHIGDIQKRFFDSGRFPFNNRVGHAMITNGYGRHVGKQWGRLPDVIDLYHPLYTPQYAARPDKCRVVFTYSNTHGNKSRINAKCPAETKEGLGKIDGVDIKYLHGVSFEESMGEKIRSHIVLDEIFSPYTHLSSLEGAAVGACVLVNYDDITVKELCKSVGAPIDSYPFVKVTPKTAREKIEYFRDNPGEREERGRYARDWVLRYYRPESLLKKYVEFYAARCSG